MSQHRSTSHSNGHSRSVQVFQDSSTQRPVIPNSDKWLAELSLPTVPVNGSSNGHNGSRNGSHNGSNRVNGRALPIRSVPEWFREAQSPEFRHFIECENEHVDAQTAHLESLQEKLFQEMLDHLPAREETHPEKNGRYFYYEVYYRNKPFPVIRRIFGSQSGRSSLVLDYNKLAEGEDFFNPFNTSNQSLNYWPSPGNRYLAFLVDQRGDELYTLRIKDLRTGELLPDQVPYCAGTLAWANDGRTLFYTRSEGEIANSLFRHELGTDSSQDTVVMTESDPRFEVSVEKSQNGKFIVVRIASHTSGETYLIDALHTTKPPKLIQPRVPNLEYHVIPHGRSLFILTNDGAENFRVVKAPLSSPGRENWSRILRYDPRVYTYDFGLTRGYLVLYQRVASTGKERIKAVNIKTKKHHIVDPPVESPLLEVSGHQMPDTRAQCTFLSFSSLRLLGKGYWYNPRTRTFRLATENTIKGYDPERYEELSLQATSYDGAQVPISLIRRKDFKEVGPVLLYGYGAYSTKYETNLDGHLERGITSAFRLSLLDRGYTIALAHVRGGDEGGAQWYKDGIGLNKRKPILDFIACAEELIERGVTEPERLAVWGGSAGGLVVGSAVVQRPELFQAAILKVPVLDITRIMSDPSQPLVAFDYDEFGDPHNPRVARYLKSYSPVENLKPALYPNILITAGYVDPRVVINGPARFVSRLREVSLNDEDTHLLLKTDMGAGHFGYPGRHEELRALALKEAFLLDCVGEGELLEH